MLVTTKIKIDLQRPSYPVVVNAVQGDQNTRQLEISLFSGSVAWMVPDNVAVAMRYCKPDNTNGYYDTMPDGTASFAVSENTVSVLLAPQMLTVPGTVVAQVVLHLGTQTLATFSFYIRVEADPSAGAVTSEDYVNWAQWIKSELDAYLEQLETSGEFVGGTFVGDVNMNGHALSGLREPVAPDDAATKEYVDKNAGTGAVSTVAGVAPDETGNVPLDAASVKALAITGGTMEGAINMNGQKLSGLNAPTADDEAATKGFVSSEIKKIDVSSQISGKVDKSSVVNNFTTTEEGFVADARTVKVLSERGTVTQKIVVAGTSTTIAWGAISGSEITISPGVYLIGIFLRSDAGAATCWLVENGQTILSGDHYILANSTEGGVVSAPVKPMVFDSETTLSLGNESGAAWKCTQLALWAVKLS